jgi:transposase
MKKVVRLTESDLTRIVKRLINEEITSDKLEKVKSRLGEFTYKMLKMRYVDNVSIKDIAEKIKASEATVRIKIKKGIQSVDKILDFMDKESKVTDEDRKKISDEMIKQDIYSFTTKLIVMVDHFSKTLSQDEINRVLRKLIK